MIVSHFLTRLKQFFKQRLTITQASGLPLSLLILLWIIFLWLPYTGAPILNLRKWISVWDIGTQKLVLPLQTTGVQQIFEIFTIFGAWIVVLILTMLTSCFLFLKKRFKSAMIFLFTLFGSEVSLAFAKMTVSRPRPLEGVIIEHTSSFPSGHANVAVVFYGFLLFFLLKEIHDPVKKILIFSIGSILILLIGGSRIILGVHFLSDVLVGFLHGLLWLWIGVNLQKMQVKNKGRFLI